MTPAERQRRHRARLKQGQRVYRIAADEADLCTKLVQAGYLAPLAADDPEKQRQALERLVADLELERHA